MLGWSSWAAARISRWKRVTASGLARRSLRMSLRATILSELPVAALRTDTRATATQTFDLSAVDGFNVALVAKSTYHQVRFGYTTQPATGVPTRLARHTVRAFVGRKHRPALPLPRAHAPHGQARQGRGAVRHGLAALGAAAGQGARRVWTIYVDQARSYSRNTTPQLSYSLPIVEAGACPPHPASSRPPSHRRPPSQLRRPPVRRRSRRCPAFRS